MKKLLLFLSVLLSASAFAQTMPLPAHASPFTGNVRGFYFVAPTCFTITGADIPTDAGTGNQSIAIVRLNATPPLYSTTTNSFTVLFLVQNGSSTGTFPLNIQVEQGDIIGVLGQRGTTNSYGAASYTSNVNGFPTTLNRLGMQFPLTTTAPQDLWTENGGSISRVNLHYTPTITYNATSTMLTSNSFQFADAADTSFTSVWDYGDGSPLDTVDNPSHTYSASGTYNVCSYITNSCGTDTVCTSVNACLLTSAGYTSTAAGGMVSFTDASIDATSWSWDFGDGSPTDNTQNPSHTYSASGTYNVCLISGNVCSADTSCSMITVCIPVAATYTSSTAGGNASFTDASSGAPTAWAWDFGDGSPIDNNQNPSHTYTADGTYNVCLIAASGCSADTSCSTVTICLPVTASYSSSASGGNATFLDASTGATSWSWDFGDGSPVDNNQNTSHTYTADGTYNVCLIAASGCTADTSCTTVTICLPVAAAYTSSTNGGTAMFTDGSTNASGWIWDFGDGSPTDNNQNPSHTYSVNGTYAVCLIAMSGCASDTICDTVTICIPTSAGFSLMATGGGVVAFTDASAHATSWSWDFGDGSPTDNTQNPSHTYTVNGTYQVCLVATNACSSDTLCSTVTVCPEALAPAFSYTGSNLNYSFTNSSSGASGYLWDFDDNGATSSSASPSYTFVNTGMHIVCLAAWNDCGDTTVTCDSVLVQVAGVTENGAAASISVYPNPFSENATLLVQSQNLSGSFLLEIFDLSGQVVRTQNGVLNQQLSIGKEDLASGVYFYRVSKDGAPLGKGKLSVR